MLNKANIKVRVCKQLLGCFIMHWTIVTLALSSCIHITFNVTRWKVYLKLVNTNDFTSCAKIQLMFQFQIYHCCPSRFISFLKFIFCVLFYCVFKVSWFFCKFFSSSLSVSYFFVPLPSSQKLPQLFYKITLCVLFNYSITFILKAILVFLLSIFKLVLCILFCCFITFG